MSQKASSLPAADRDAIERKILNIMRPVSVNRMGEDWNIKGSHFESDLKNRANDHEPWSYIENGKKIGFECKEMRWSNGTIIKTGAKPSIGVVDTESSPVSLTYPGALGAGINVKIIQDNFRWQKIVEIESLASLGTIPTDAEYLEISFKLSGDFVLPEGVITDHIPFGENSFVHPVRAWDSSPTPEDLADEVKSGAVGVIVGNIITKRIPVAWLKTATYPVHTDITITYGAENVFNSANTIYISVAALDATHFVAAYRDVGNGSKGTAIVGLISGTTISSYGAESTFNATTTAYISVAALDSTHFVVAYEDYGGAYYGIARVGVVSGTTISSFGAENVYNSGITIMNSVAKLDSTHFVVAYADNSNLNKGTAVVGVVSGTAITSYGSEYVFNSAETSAISVAALDNTHFVVGYRDAGHTNDGMAIVGVVSSGTTIAYGAENPFETVQATGISVAALDSTHFVVAYRYDAGAYYGNAKIGTVSGSTITSYGSGNIFNSVSTACISIAALDSTHFVVTYKDDGGADYGGARIGTVSGTTISEYGAENLFNSAITNYISVTALSATRFAIGYQDVGNLSYGTGIVGSIPAVRELVSLIAATTLTSASDLNVLRELVANIPAVSSISSTDLNVLRELIAAVAVQTGAVASLDILRELSATIPAETLVSAIDLVVVLNRALRGNPSITSMSSDPFIK